MKKGIIIFAVIIIFAGVLWVFSQSQHGENSLFSSSLVPTSTSAPTPTSIYKKSIRDVPSDAASTVTLTKNGFSPQVLHIGKGTTVTWINSSGNDATINSNPHPTHTAYPPLNLGVFHDGDSLQLRFRKVGTYGYHNHYDATQTGTIIVE